MADEGFTAQELVQACNKIIVYAGLIARVTSIEEVRVVCSSSSLLLAALEGFLGRRLENVIRTPSTPADRAYNFDVLVHVLSEVLSCDLSHISGQRIVEGSIEDISNILELLAALCHGRPLQSPPPSTHADAARHVSAARQQAPGQDAPTSSARSPGASEPHSPGHRAGAPHQPPDGSRLARPPSGRETAGHLTDDGGGGGSGSETGRSREGHSLGEEEEPDSDDGARRQPWYHRQPQQRRRQQQQQQQQQPARSAGEDEVAAAAHRQHTYLPQQQYTEAGSTERVEHLEAHEDDAAGGLAAAAVSAASPGVGIRVRRRRSSARARQRTVTSLHRAALSSHHHLGGPPQQHPHHHHHVPLSPIPEVSREGYENSRASKEAFSGLQGAEGGRRSPAAVTARASPRSHHQHQQQHHLFTADADARRSAGGASSTISVPSLQQDDLRRLSSSPDSAVARLPLRQQQHPRSPLQQQQHPRSPLQQQQRPYHDLAAAAAAGGASTSPSSYSAGTSTLLERALSHAEAALRGLGREREGFYYNEGEEEAEEEAERAATRGRRRARKQQQQHQQPQPGSSRMKHQHQPSSTDGASASQRGGGGAGGGGGGGRGVVRGGGGPPAYEPARRALHSAPRPDAARQSGGRVEQHAAFLRRAKRVMLAADGAASSPSPTTTTSWGMGTRPTGASRQGSGSLSSASRGLFSSSASASGGSQSRDVGRRRPATAAGAGSEAAARGRGGAQRWEEGAAAAPLRRGRRQWSVRVGGGGTGGGGADAHEALVRALREGAAPEAAVAEAEARARKLVQRTGGAGGAEAALASLAPQPPGPVSASALQLNPELEGKLRSLYRLLTEDPRQRAARTAVQSMAVTDDLLRHARRRALLGRLSSARARRESALRTTSERLREQGREYEKRVEQLRLQRVASEWSASQRGAAMRRALAAEVALRDTFLQVLEEEKEVLLAARRDARADAIAAFPTYKRAMRKAEQDYVEVFELLERMLASERQQRVASDREAHQAQRHFNALAAGLVADRVQELLGRVAREDAAAAARRSIATQPRARRALVAQIRRLLGLPA